MRDKIRKFLIDGDFDECEINTIIDFISKIPVSELLANHIKEDGVLLGWHSNIACWIMDNLGIVAYEPRNELAQKFIKKFFDINYDWIDLLNKEGRSYEVDMKLFDEDSNEKSSEDLLMTDKEYREKLVIEKMIHPEENILDNGPSFEGCIIKLNRLKNEIRKTLEDGQNSDLKSIQQRERQINDIKEILKYMNSLPAEPMEEDKK